MTIDIQPEDDLVFDRLKSSGRVTHDLRRLITQRYNYCSQCDHLVFRGRPAFAGYTDQQAPVFACARCAQTDMVELATPVYWDGTLNLSIDDDTTLWRYMDFAKFTAMLKQRGLYLPRADLMDDRFEGAVGLARRQADWDNYYLDFYRKLVREPSPDGRPSPYSEDEIEKHSQRMLAETKAAHAGARLRPVSCWHANSGESEAQWRLYCPPPTIGIAVRSTVGRLWDAMAEAPDALVGRVHYLDFAKGFAVNGRERIFCKRASLSHEREVRAVLLDEVPDPPPGRLVACDLSALIQEVIISPFAPSWFEEIVRDLIDRFGLHLPVRPSELLEAPFY